MSKVRVLSNEEAQNLNGGMTWRGRRTSTNIVDRRSTLAKLNARGYNNGNGSDHTEYYRSTYRRSSSSSGGGSCNRTRSGKGLTA